jgi:hypothetical protein
MPTAANQDAYPNQPWGQQPAWGQGQWGQSNNPWGSGNAPWAQQWGGPPFWHPAGFSRPAAIAFTVLGFIFWWPVGLAILFYMLGTGRMGCFGRRAMRKMQQQGNTWTPPWASMRQPTSGNHAFDEYRQETLRRLEEEQQEFGSFLERLRFAKDKAEFDQFMAERRTRPAAPPTEDRPQA